MNKSGDMRQTKCGGMSLKRQDSQERTMKKMTLTAWAQILYRKGMIDSAKLGRMIALIEAMKDTKTGQSAAS